MELQLPLPLLSCLKAVREGFFELCVRVGEQALHALMEHDRTELCGTTVSDRVDIRETTYRDLIEDHPLQPFNAACFTGPRASFDTGHLEIARACQQRQEEASPFQVGVFELPEAVQSADLELHEMIRILKDPWSAWQVIRPRAALLARARRHSESVSSGSAPAEIGSSSNVASTSSHGVDRGDSSLTSD